MSLIVTASVPNRSGKMQAIGRNNQVLQRQFQARFELWRRGLAPGLGRERSTSYGDACLATWRARHPTLIAWRESRPRSGGSASDVSGATATCPRIARHIARQRWRCLYLKMRAPTPPRHRSGHSGPSATTTWCLPSMSCTSRRFGRVKRSSSNAVIPAPTSSSPSGWPGSPGRSEERKLFKQSGQLPSSARCLP